MISKSILTNLISNAVKDNDKEQKEVEIGYLETSEGQLPQPIVFYIRDNGIGIRYT